MHDPNMNLNTIINYFWLTYSLRKLVTTKAVSMQIASIWPTWNKFLRPNLSIKNVAHTTAMQSANEAIAEKVIATSLVADFSIMKVEYVFINVIPMNCYAAASRKPNSILGM